MKINNVVCPNCGTNPARLRKIVKRLVAAEVAASWKGSLTDAEDSIEVEVELKYARLEWKTELERISE